MTNPASKPEGTVPESTTREHSAGPTDREGQRGRIVERLCAESSPLRDEGVRVVVDYVLDRRIRDVLDLEAGRAIVVKALREDNVRRVMDRHIRPGWRRYTAHVAASEETVGALVPEPARAKIRRIVEKSRIPRGEWAEGIVEPALMRRLFAPVWTNLLLSFAKRLPLPGIGAATGAAAAAGSAVGRGVGGIAERLSRSVQERAEKIVDAGRNVMGGLGAEVEKRFQSAARDFSDGAAGMWREALRDRMKSAEGRELAAQITQQVIDHVMATKLAELHRDAESVPVEDILDVVPEIVGHAAPRAFVQKIVSNEIAFFLEHEGSRTFREVLAELGVLDEVRAVALRETGRLARDLFAAPAFGDWLGRVLDA